MALQIPGSLGGIKNLRLNIYLTKNSYLPTITCASRPVYKKAPTHVKLMGGIIWVLRLEKVTAKSISGDQ